jgi:surfeit locus 1 family protein
VDRDATESKAAVRTDAYPIGGLTVISFHNNHLVYAITWYVLALMIAGGAWLLLRHEFAPNPALCHNTIEP